MKLYDQTESLRKRSAYEVYGIQARNNNFSDYMLRSSCELFQLYYLCTVCSLLLDPAITNLSIFLLVISLPLSSIFTISNEYQFEYQLFRLVSKRRLSAVKRLSETAMASPVWYMNTFGGVQGFTKSTAFTSNQTAHLSRILAQHGDPQLSFDRLQFKKSPSGLGLFARHLFEISFHFEVGWKLVQHKRKRTLIRNLVILRNKRLLVNAWRGLWDVMSSIISEGWESRYHVVNLSAGTLLWLLKLSRIWRDNRICAKSLIFRYSRRWKQKVLQSQLFV